MAELAILASASTPLPADPADQRARPRYLCGTVTLTRVTVPATQLRYFAWIHDISDEGIGLDVLAPMARGVSLVFTLKPSEVDSGIKLHAQVIHATPAGSFYRVGCKFTRPLRPGVLAKVLQQLRGES